MSGHATRHERTSCVRPAKLRASPKQTTGTASPRRPGTVLSVPPVRRHCATHHCQPGFIRAARPRRRRPAPPSHRRRRPLSASLPKPPGSPANRHVSVSARPSRALPADGMRHIHASRFAAHPDDAERGAESFPISFVAPRRRLPAGHPSPGFVPRRRRTRRVRRLDSHRAPRADLVLPNDVPDRQSDVSLLPARRRVVPASHSGDGTPHRRWRLCSPERGHHNTPPCRPRGRTTRAARFQRAAMGHFVTSPSRRETARRALRHLRTDPPSLISASRKLVTAAESRTRLQLPRPTLAARRTPRAPPGCRGSPASLSPRIRSLGADARVLRGLCRRRRSMASPSVGERRAMPSVPAASHSPLSPTSVPSLPLAAPQGRSPSGWRTTPIDPTG